jgi:16S rRNA (cytidine1402-2'-O)-methyltransferase
MSKLIIVPTPIGNFGDISPRCLAALAGCDLVLCEDTRVCSKLLKHFNIEKRMLVYRDDNEETRVPKIVDFIREGRVVCLTSDAGTPVISDPGYRIVRACRRFDIPVESIPGACAGIVALAASGLPTNGFLFLGFLPNRESARIKTFQKYINFEYSVVFYESCHRLSKFLENLLAIHGPCRTICVAKEMTKIHETFLVGEVGQVLPRIVKSHPKGEYVVVVAPENFKL